MTKCSEASVTPEAAATGSETNATEKCFRERFGRLSCWSVVGCFRTEAGDRVHLLRIRRSPRKKPRVTYVRRVSDRWSRDTKHLFIFLSWRFGPRNNDLDFSVIQDSGRISEHCVDISSHFDIFVSVKGSEGPVCSLVSMVTVTFHDDPADWDPKPKV